MSKPSHQPLSPTQLQAMQHLASALLALVDQAGAQGVVLLVDWGDATTVAAGVTRQADIAAVFPRLVRAAPEAVSDWARRVRAGQGQVVVGEKAS